MKIIVERGEKKMLITAMKVKRMIKMNNRLLAIVSITLDEMIAIHDIKIIESDHGIFLAMPSRKLGNSFVDVAHPIHQQARKGIENLVFSAYEVVKNENYGDAYFVLTSTNASSFMDQSLSDFEIEYAIAMEKIQLHYQKDEDD